MGFVAFVMHRHIGRDILGRNVEAVKPRAAERLRLRRRIQGGSHADAKAIAPHLDHQFIAPHLCDGTVPQQHGIKP